VAWPLPAWPPAPSNKLAHMSTEAVRAVQRWHCESCGYIYDVADGDPDGGIPAGTAFEDIPESWFCPVCGARKRDFTPYED
jgi:rubredoxin